MRNTRERYFRAEGRALPKAEGKKKLVMFQNQDRSQHEYKVGSGEKSNQRFHWRSEQGPSCRTFVAMETRSCKKGSHTLQFMFLKRLWGERMKRRKPVSCHWSPGKKWCWLDWGGSYKLKDKGTDLRLLLADRTCWWIVSEESNLTPRFRAWAWCHHLKCMWGSTLDLFHLWCLLVDSEAGRLLRVRSGEEEGS